MDGGGAADGVERALRDLTPRVVAAVVRRYGDFAAAEDAVQDALLAAHGAWIEGGVPANPGGWLYRVACRRMQDRRDDEVARRRRELQAWTRSAASDTAPSAEDAGATDRDDTLVLLFLCCHPSLPPNAAIALTLRAVAGLTTAEIARAFLVPETTMAQRIHRAKQTIADAGLAFELPEPAELDARLAAVLHVLYLLFNEGYDASFGPDLARDDLAREALRLARGLRAAFPTHAETAGLCALLLLTDARRAARTNARGELVPLDEQDRSRWDRAAIAEGTALVTEAFARGVVGPYQLQAAIAALHGEAASVEATDWPQILALYDVLLRMTQNPVVALNRAVAAAMVHGPEHGLAELRALERDALLAGTHRLEAVRAHLLERAGDAESARRSYRAAAERATNAAERGYLLAKAARLG